MASDTLTDKRSIRNIELILEIMTEFVWQIIQLRISQYIICLSSPKCQLLSFSPAERGLSAADLYFIFYCLALTTIFYVSLKNYLSSKAWYMATSLSLSILKLVRIERQVFCCPIYSYQIISSVSSETFLGNFLPFSPSLCLKVENISIHFIRFFQNKSTERLQGMLKVHYSSLSSILKPFPVTGALQVVCFITFFFHLTERTHLSKVHSSAPNVFPCLYIDIDRDIDNSFRGTI